MVQCEYRCMCGEKDCARTPDECRKLLIEKLMKRDNTIKQQRERFEKELEAMKEAEGEPEVHFICDRRNCRSCWDDCRGYTTNSRHAAQFPMEGTEFCEVG